MGGYSMYNHTPSQGQVKVRSEPLITISLYLSDTWINLQMRLCLKSCNCANQTLQLRHPTKTLLNFSQARTTLQHLFEKMCLTALFRALRDQSAR